MQKKKIYLILTDTGTVFTRLIKAYTKKPFNHASICLDENLSNVYSFGRKMPNNPFIGGFVKEDFQATIFLHARCAVYSCEVSTEQFQKAKTFINQIEEQQHLYHYNLIGLFGVMFNKSIKRKRAFFCSQFVSSVLEEGKIISFTKPTSLITPYDLQKTSEFQLEYQGNLADFERIAINHNNQISVC
ncbi:hypothetical protein SAMN05216389_104171 [Oceanobacillus limi]|uniref:Permuted papain-like amidase enzyme, YaeF/YiiX, C92 family n=1 Tax=Oceanobacillus limi TaxID=930131 RepID=A0A1I0B426_9BACI|nr:hypothetical protein [Oceanobacillus limi]SET01474.1 hypothetical protein SAMN05216389_104171 [Oceanobacillus limi]